MDADCLPALLRLTTHVLALTLRVAAGDEQAALEAEELAATVGGSGLWTRTGWR